MADTRMSREEREAFLAELHVGVLAIPRPSGPPLTAPIWYDYVPGGEIRILTGPESMKGRLLEERLEVTLVAQNETPPYAYVSVEGTVTGIRPADEATDARPMARRYLGEQMGDAYSDANAGRESVLVSIRPDRWLTVDYGKSNPLG
jgi:PPOX class probable F420-dependent enzyme